ncbi:hypothetical protein [Allomuricauda sp. F6463D]|uniref:hypothetical protein n=1 Tax=Allomuricauda sp. F6463D TaxID=2926409 RepID=UPI001FF21C95|nr:hypothetical protein [Muricauda sp. F6463D]MCK0161661.1 hypothetical protein [Muricauda sp. F6463D]
MQYAVKNDISAMKNYRSVMLNLFQHPIIVGQKSSDNLKPVQVDVGATKVMRIVRSAQNDFKNY